MRLLLSNKFFIASLIVSLCITSLNIFWIFLNNTPVFYDTAGHTVLAHIYAQVILGKSTFHPILDFLIISPYYPPFMFVLGSLISILFGFDYKVLQYFSVLFLPVSTIFMFLITQKITKSPPWALSSSLFFLLFPIMWQQSRFFMLDIPLLTFLLASIYFLLLSENFTKRKYIFFFVLFASFAELTKWYAGLYLLIPFLYIIFTSDKKVKGFKTLIPFAILSGVLILPWYLVNSASLISNASIFQRPDFGDPVGILSIKNFLYYPALIINFLIVSWQFVWLIISAALFLFAPTRFRFLVILQIIFIYLIFTFIGNKNPRYLIPLLPYFALIMGFGIVAIFKHSRVLSLIILGILTFLNTSLFTINSFGWPLHLDKTFKVSSSNKQDFILFADFSSYYVPYKFERFTWSPKELVSDLSEISEGQNSYILVVGNSPFLSVAGLEVYSVSMAPHLQFREPPFDSLSAMEPSKIEEFLKDYTYLLIPEEFVGPVEQGNYANLHKIREYILGGKIRDFALVQTYKLPNNESLFLLSRNPGENILDIQILNDSLLVTRSPAVAKIYIQFEDINGNWSQEVIDTKQTQYSKNILEIKTVRIDYPPHLLLPNLDDLWEYDGNIQFSRVVEE